MVEELAEPNMIRDQMEKIYGETPPDRHSLEHRISTEGTRGVGRNRASPALQDNRHGMWSTSMNPCLTRTLSPILNFGANSDCNFFDMVWRKRVLASCVQSTAARIITCVSVSASFRVPV